MISTEHLIQELKEELHSARMQLKEKDEKVCDDFLCFTMKIFSRLWFCGVNFECSLISLFSDQSPLTYAPNCWPRYPRANGEVVPGLIFWSLWTFSYFVYAKKIPKRLLIIGNVLCAPILMPYIKFDRILHLFQEAYNMVNQEKAKVELSEKLQMESKMKVSIFTTWTWNLNLLKYKTYLAIFSWSLCRGGDCDV